MMMTTETGPATARERAYARAIPLLARHARYRAEARRGPPPRRALFGHLAAQAERAIGRLIEIARSTPEGP